MSSEVSKGTVAASVSMLLMMSFFVIIEHTSATVKNKVTIPLTDPEVGGLITMLTFALPLIHNWV